MDVRPKTIQIFLPDGYPRSIRIAEITSRNVQTILIPRNKLKEADQRSEIKNVGIYFLFGESGDKAKPVVYVGEAEDCYQRLKQHNQSKDFWNTAVAVISKTNSFTKAHVKYLEWFSYSVITETDRYSLDNNAIPAKPFITESMEADLMDSFDSIKILLSTLGYSIFEVITKSQNKDIMFCKGKDAQAEGEYIDDGFVVFKGSKANLKESKTAGSWVENMRKKLVDSGILVRDGEVYVFSSDYIFSSPSAAAVTVLARRANGWTEWKNKDGKTLDELKRSSSSETSD